MIATRTTELGNRFHKDAYRLRHEEERYLAPTSLFANDRMCSFYLVHLGCCLFLHCNPLNICAIFFHGSAQNKPQSLPEALYLSLSLTKFDLLDEI
jgi:hypothetical protein